MSDEWTPGFGKPYFREPKFYTSPKVKDANLPDDRTNVPRPYIRTNQRFYTNEEILDIWAKPLEGFQVTAEEQAQINKNPMVVNKLVMMSGESPCKCHVQNMFLDKCEDPKVGTSNKSMLQDTACNYHYFRLLKCISKHWRWYEARREALRAALPEDLKAQTRPLHQFTRFDVDPYEYYDEFKGEGKKL